MVLSNLVKNTQFYINKLLINNRITDKMITDYSEMSTRNLHSWLQYSLINAGINESLSAVPEVKVYYSEKLIPSIYDTRLKDTLRSFNRVDVAYYDEKKLRGIAEVVSVDGAHGCHLSQELSLPWLSLRDSLTYLIDNNSDNFEFVVILNVLPRKMRTIPWKTVDVKHEELKKSHNYYNLFNQEWKVLVDDLNKKINVKMITLIAKNEIKTHPL